LSVPESGTQGAGMVAAHELLVTMADTVAAAVARAAWGVVARDAPLCIAIAAERITARAEHRSITDLCVRALSNRASMACRRRALITLEVAAQLEVMADDCVAIAETGVILAELPELRPHLDVPYLFEMTCEQVGSVLAALNTGGHSDIAAAAQRLTQVKDHRVRLAADLVTLMMEDPDSVRGATELVIVAEHLERISARATDVVELLDSADGAPLRALG
jgi:phosphate transport system protein